MRVSELTGPLLDYWVAKAEGLYRPEIWKNHWESGPKCMYQTMSTHEIYSPSTDWSQGGPIIEREKIRFGDDYDPKAMRWVVFAYIGMGKPSYGDSALEAAMRAYLACKFGEEVADE